MNTAIKIDEWSLHELELQAFEQGVRQAHVGAIMCSSSRSAVDTGFHVLVSATTCCSTGSPADVGFTGSILTDFGAVHRLDDILGGVDSAIPNGNTAGIRDEPNPGHLRIPRSTTTCANGTGFPGSTPAPARH